MHPIKLAIVGASSTGKTTLLTHLEASYKDDARIIFVHESARQFFTENPDKIEFTLPIQEKILSLVFENEKKAELKNPFVIITDTSAIETVLYTKVQGDEDGAASLLEKVRPHIKSYTRFLLLNPDDVLFENDEIRRETKETRDSIHKLLVEFYKKEHLPFTLISGTIPERQKRIHDIIQTYLTK